MMRRACLPAVALTALLALLASTGVGKEPAKEPPPPATNDATVASNGLAIDLYRRLVREKGDGSFFFSPYSVSAALALAAEGARGETADEMGKVLRFPSSLRRASADRPWDLAPIHSGLARLQRQFETATRPPAASVTARLEQLRKGLDAANKAVRGGGGYAEYQKAQKLADELNKLQETLDTYELRTANALWAEKSYPFAADYLATINRYHGAAAQPVDFIKDHEAERKRINLWVAKQTRDRVKDLIPPKAVNHLTRLVIANAVYFKGTWREPFRAQATREQDFTLATGKKQTVKMMREHLGGTRYGAFNKDGSFFNTPTEVPEGNADPKQQYPGAGGFELLEMLYKGGEVSMVVIAPRSADGLPGVEKLLSSERLATWLKQARDRDVYVEMPRFRLESSFKLNDALVALGMKRAFTEPGQKGGAQFGGMSLAKDAVNQLYISAALHKAFVEVGEKGTEAAAATAVLVEKKKSDDAKARTVPFTPRFQANKPFLFLIRDVKSGTVLFLGRLTQPTA